MSVRGELAMPACQQHCWLDPEGWKGAGEGEERGEVYPSSGAVFSTFGAQEREGRWSQVVAQAGGGRHRIKPRRHLRGIKKDTRAP